MANLIRSQALYYEDPFSTRFDAVITKVIPNISGDHTIILDRTYFYPTGGGQDHDIGTINGCQVIDVSKDEETGIVNHITMEELPLGPAKCEIDWEHRLRNMQHHSSQHLLTQCVLRLYEFPTVSANINGYTPSTLDIIADRLLADSELEEAEKLANQIIYENRAIHTYFVEPEDLVKIQLRRPPKVSENIRIVEIDSFDYSACGGTHCSNTGSIGIVKVLKNERINNKTRIHFIAGLQALELFQDYQNTIVKLAAQLSVNAQELHPTVERIIEEMKDSQKEIQVLKRKNLAYEAQILISRSDVVRDKNFICSHYENQPANEIRMLADILKSQNNLVAILTSYDMKRLSIVVTCGKATQVDAAAILQSILNQFDGKGGGDNQIAQGGGVITKENLDRILTTFAQIARELI